MLRRSRLRPLYMYSKSKGKLHHRQLVRCQAPRNQGPNPKDIKRASISKTADLRNVNCHLTPPPPQSPPPPFCWASGAGQGWRGNLIKGSPLTKAPPLQLVNSSRPAETKAQKKGSSSVLGCLLI